VAATGVGPLCRQPQRRRFWLKSRHGASLSGGWPIQVGKLVPERN